MLARRGVQSPIASPATAINHEGQPCWFLGKGSGRGRRRSAVGTSVWKLPVCLAFSLCFTSFLTLTALTASVTMTEGWSELRPWSGDPAMLRRCPNVVLLITQPIFQAFEWCVYMGANRRVVFRRRQTDVADPVVETTALRTKEQ